MNKNILWALLLGVVFIGLAVGSIMSNEAAPKKEPQAQEVKWVDNPKNPINVCIAKEGIPITSVWDGRLKDCKKL